MIATLSSDVTNVARHHPRERAIRYIREALKSIGRCDWSIAESNVGAAMHRLGWNGTRCCAHSLPLDDAPNMLRIVARSIHGGQVSPKTLIMQLDSVRSTLAIAACAEQRMRAKRVNDRRSSGVCVSCGVDRATVMDYCRDCAEAMT